MTTGQLQLFGRQRGADPFGALCDRLGVDAGPGWPDRFGHSIHGWLSRQNRRPVRTLSLFSGGGGLDIGFHDCGFEIEELVEYDQRFAKTLTRACESDGYFGSGRVRCMDIRDYNPDPDSGIEFVIGGPPCQTFSAAGRRAAGVRGINEARGTLFREYVRILESLKPRGFLFENVYGITGAQGGRAWVAIVEAFAAAGYQVQHRILDSADYGVPQHRERLFIVGIREGDFRFPAPTHGPDSPSGRPHYSAGEAISGAVDLAAAPQSGLGGRYGYLLAEIPPGLNYSFFTERMGHPSPIFAWRSKFSDFLYKADPAVPVRTIKAQGGQYTGPFHWDARPFHVKELSRLQTFPDDYELAGGRQLVIHQLGNSVPPQLGRILALALLEQVFEETLPLHLPTLHHGAELGFRRRKRLLTPVYRTKAEASLREEPRRAPGMPRGRRYWAHVGETFDYQEVAASVATHSVRFAASGSQWRISVRGVMAPDHKRRISIIVRPVRGQTWGLSASEVRLDAGPLEALTFTAAWKAFECELARAQIKADLVQLCGYYQYDPCIEARMEIQPSRGVPRRWTRLARIVAGTATRAILSGTRFEEILELERGEMLQFAQFLRALGYEVRNHNTNPEIPRNHFLIPYAFPTLTAQSVQLGKRLT